MRSKLHLIALLCLGCYSGLAQSPPKLVTEGRSLSGKEMIFVAEIHSINERWAFYESLSSHLVANNGIRNIILESGHAEAWLLNAYLHHSDTTYFKYFPQDVSVRHFLNHLRLINNALPIEKKLNIRGMDFDRMDFAIAARQILQHSPKSSTTAFSKYIFAIPDSMLTKVHMTSQQHLMRRKETAKSQKMFAADKAILKQQLPPEDFAALELIFENPNTEKKWARRDKGMYRNIRKQHLLHEPFLCIAGRYHIEYKRREVHHSLMKKLVRHNKQSVNKMAVIDEVRNGAFQEQNLFIPDGTAQKMSYGTAGPEYFIKSDTAMQRAFSNYFAPQQQCTLVYKDVFADLVKKDNHGLDSWYIFFGEPPAKKQQASN